MPLPNPRKERLSSRSIVELLQLTCLCLIQYYRIHETVYGRGKLKASVEED